MPKKKIMCTTPDCGRKAEMFVAAWSKDRAWSEYRCRRHAARLIRLRAGLILRFNQNVTVRPIGPIDYKDAQVKPGAKKGARK